MTAIFGDLAGPARAHLDAAAEAGAGLSGDGVIEAVSAVGRIVRTLSRYLADIAPHDLVDAITNTSLDAQERAAVDAREALRLAALTLQRGVHDVGDGPGTLANPVAQHLQAAGAGLAAGRDLLRAHFTTSPEGIQSPSSDWSAVITSVAVRRALLAEASRWTQQLAWLLARLSPAPHTDGAIPATAVQALAGGCRWLLIANRALAGGQREDPARAPDAFLLDAVPAAALPPRLPPRKPEDLAGLAEGLASSAARMRTISWATAGHAARSPAMTADSWRWKARAAGVICHISEQLLTELASSPAAGAAGFGEGQALRAGAEAVRQAWQRWREVAAVWSDITTDTQGLTALGISDTGDLVVRLGRVAFTDPRWAPSRRRRAPLRDPDDLAPGLEQFRIVLGTVHRAVDALAVVAEADERAVMLAVRASRLHVPRRTLPDLPDLPYRFAPPGPAAPAAVLDAHRAAGEATIIAAAELDVLAVTAQAPSRILGLARAALGEPVVRREQSAGEQVAMQGALLRGNARLAERRQAGPVEQAVRRLPAADEVLILRAKVIDTAGHAVIRDARASAETPRMTGTDGIDAARSAADLASKNFPQEGAVPISASPQTRPRLSNPRGPVSARSSPRAR